MRIKLPNPSRTFISSDFHYMHKNICKGCTSWKDGATRPYDDPETMSKDLVDNINSRVGRDDWLIHMGDWTFGGAGKLEEFRGRINCRNIICLMGNHDQAGGYEYNTVTNCWNHRKPSRFSPSLFSLTTDYLEFRYDKTLYCLSHYPLASWNESGRGSVMLHGHCHNNLHKDFCRGRIFDMGVDNPRWDFKPVQLTKIHEIAMDTRIYTSDHHTGDLTGW